jgi:hypothetical protein
LPTGQGLILLRSVPPIIMDMTPWTKRKDAATLQRDKGEFEAAVRQELDRTR